MRREQIDKLKKLANYIRRGDDEPVIYCEMLDALITEFMNENGPIYEAVAYPHLCDFESESWGFYRGPKEKILEKFKNNIQAGWTVRLDEIEIKEIQ